MEILITVAIIVGLFILAGVLFLVFKNPGSKLLVSLLEKNEEHRSKSKDEIESGVKGLLLNHQEIMDRIAAELKDQLKDSQREIKDLRGQNMAIREQLSHTAKMTENLQVSTEGLKNLLSNNRLRGDWGEQVAEDLLIAAGFVEKVNYLKQTTTEAGRPDFTILLPDGIRLNVDAKFPFDDLVAYQSAKTDMDKKRSLQNFEAAVKDKVKAITSKDYIDPEAQTLDFVVMFIPNEMIFSFIYEKLPGINQYCNERRVILAGPFGFTALVRLVLQAHKNFRYEKGLQQIIGLIAKFQSEYGKFSDSMDKLGRQIDTAQRIFNEVETTRSRQLTRLVEKIGEESQRNELTGPALVEVVEAEEVEELPRIGAGR